MDEVLALSLQSMQGDRARVDQIAMNLANALTPGYKRGVAVQPTVGASFAAHLAGAEAGAQTQIPADAVSLRADMRTGTFKSTGHALDVALAGKGYFEVMTENGPAFTRLGAFRLDAAGRLVTQHGHAVMGQAGEIVLDTAAPVITAGGAVVTPGTTEDAPFAQLKIVEFEAEAVPRPLGDGLVAMNEGLKLVAPQDVKLRQGFLENSNVSAAHEMTQLTQVVRHFESMSRVAQGYDEMLGTAIRKLGETS